MKTYIKKWYIAALMLAVVCSMMLPVTAFAQDEEYVEPSIVVTGEPTEPVLAGSTVTFQVSVNADETDDITGWYLTKDHQDSEGWINSEQQDVITEQVVRGESYEVSVYVPENFEAFPCLTVWLCNDVGSYLDWAFVGEDVQVQKKLTGSIGWTPVEEVIAGQAYPFSVTYTNHSGEAFENVTVETCAVAHELQWTATVAYNAQEGLVIGENGSAVIERIGAGESYTVSGTITLPLEAVGDLATHVSQYLFVGDTLMVSVSSEEVATSEANYRFEIVAPKRPDGPAGGTTDKPSSGNQTSDGQTSGGTNKTSVKTNVAKSSAVKTGDSAPIAGWIAVGMTGVYAGIVAWRKRKNLR